MQKKMMAVAVAGALGAPAIALAQGASTVQVYGTIYLEYAYVNQGDKAPGSEFINTDTFQTGGSEIGFRGEEKLGGNLSAWFQCNSTFDVRGASPEGFCGRNSAIGLKGGFGSIYFGNWDTPFKRIMGSNRIVNETGVWGAAAILTGGASSYNGRATPGAFSRRNNNTIFYDSPNFSGFTVNLAMSTIGTSVNSATATTNLTGVKPRLYSIGANYTAGNWNVGAAYEYHDNFWPTGAATDGSDYGWGLTAGYTFKQIGLKLGAAYSQYKWDTTSITDGKVSTWNLAADWNISGPHSLIAGYTAAGDTKGSYGGAPVGGLCTVAAVGERNFNCGQGDTSVALYQLSYQYAFSKRTQVRFGGAILKNDSNAQYRLTGMNTPGAGEDQKTLGVSVRHTF
jgi:predicted porin